MIGIRVSNSDIKAIKDIHISFVGSNVKRIITFYTEVFYLLEKVNQTPSYSKTCVTRKIQEIKSATNSDDYKSLLQRLLKSKQAIPNEKAIYIIKYANKRIKEANQTKVVIGLLEALLLDYDSILGIDLEDNASRIHYSNLQTKYTPILFLFDSIFNYDTWFSNLKTNELWGPYQLTNKLNLNTCPYCNRQYTFTMMKIDGSKIARPELDHFYSKSKHPLLALSFFNLIPSCSVCNSSIKGASEISFNTHLNPYEKNTKHDLIRFTYIPKDYNSSIGKSDKLEIIATYNGDPKNVSLKTKVEGNIDLFCLNKVYENHIDVVQEIIRKRAAANDKYIEMLQATFKSLNLSTEDAYRLAFGNYYDEKDFHKRTLAKLTKDLAIELGTIIKYQP